MIPDAQLWDVYRLRMVRKILGELCHEQFLIPEAFGDGRFRVVSDDGHTEYTFVAEVLALDSWCIEETSIRRSVDGAGFPVDPVALIADFGTTLGMADDQLAAYLEEVAHTLALGAGRPAAQRRTAAQLAAAATNPVERFQQLEAAMTEGHPCFIANAGRIGFTDDDLARFAPEHGPRMRIQWLAVWADHVEFAAMAGVDYETLLDAELGAPQRNQFISTLIERGLDPADYTLVPAHPWQWAAKAKRLFAAEIAAGRIVELSPSDDEYQPQQSIRTLFNVDRPDRHYVKLSLSITNMGFTRGMSADYMGSTPAINDWVRALVDDDEFLAQIGFAVRYEVAALGYRNPAFNAVTQPGSEYRKLLSALWRSSPVELLRDGEELSTMAALLHVDHLGDTLVGALIERSGLAPREWLRRYLDAYLHPVVYLLYAHELKFSPHGENLILLLKDAVPQRVILKDIGEEVFLLGAGDDLPEACERARSTEADDTRNLGILSDVFDDFFRPFALLLHGSGLVSDDDFWAEVAASIRRLQELHPQLVDRFARWDLFAPSFGAIHLNRLQLRNRHRMVDHADSYASMVAGGHDLGNPIAAHGASAQSVSARADSGPGESGLGVAELADLVGAR